MSAAICRLRRQITQIEDAQRDSLVEVCVMSDMAIETRPAWEWRAMGATWRLRHSGRVEIEVVGALADAIAADERRWSRFLARSEVSRLNRAPGVPLQVSTETLDLLLACDNWHEQTEGAFSVMVGGALTAYGYRESQRIRPPRTSRTPKPVPIDRALVVDDAVRRLACVPEGTALDLGGVARMWSADRAAAIVRTLSDDPAILLEVGDDMVAVRGDHLVAVGNGVGDSPHAVVLRDGHALASSSWSALLWSNDDGASAHHLIDPATGAPAEPASAVVIANDAGEADAFATALAVRPSLVTKLTTTCAMVQTDRGERHTAAWESVAVYSDDLGSCNNGTNGGLTRTLRARPGSGPPVPDGATDEASTTLGFCLANDLARLSLAPIGTNAITGV